MRVFKVRYFEPANALFGNPDRFRVCFCDQIEGFSSDPKEVWLREQGREGAFPFVDGVCPDYLGEFKAEIVDEVSEEMSGQPDQFIPI